MASAITPSMEDDERFAKEMSRQLNANPRRESASRSSNKSTPAFETPRLKRARTTKHELPPTPMPIPSPMEDERRDHTDIRLPTLSTSNSMKSTPSKVAILPLKGKRRPNTAAKLSTENQALTSLAIPVNCLTKILVNEADAKCSPPPGSELLKMIEDAKQNRDIPMAVDSNVVRFIDGKWMAPQMCERCQIYANNERRLGRRLLCDRDFPCSSCVREDSQCTQGSFMTLLRPTYGYIKDPPEAENTIPTCLMPILAQRVYQNTDGTWQCEAKAQTSSLAKPRRKRDLDQFLQSDAKGGRLSQRKAKNQTILDDDKSPSRHLVKIAPRIKLKVKRKPIAMSEDPIEGVFTQKVYQEPDGSWKSDTPKSSRSVARGVKRKAEDEDFQPNSRQSSAGLTEDLVPTSPEVMIPKRKVVRTKGACQIKYHQSAQDDKPAPFGEPPVWSDKRQALCEALPYYKAYQSGAYISAGVVKAFMVDKEVGPRDKFDEEILIARVGGGRKLDEESGVMVQKADQDTSTFGLGFQRAKEYGHPVAIIAGQGNRLSPSKLPHYYNVLDWFHVTDVWCELSGKYKCWMVRLEKIRLDVKSWWASVVSDPLDPNRDTAEFETEIKYCGLCGLDSKEIYNEGWTCLHTSCVAFFDFGKPINDESLDYNARFLKERTRFTPQRQESLVPRVLTENDIDMTGGTGTEVMCKQGIVCPKCHACSRRIEWHQWTCETPGCDFTHKLQQTTITAREAISSSRSGQKEFCNTNFGIRVNQKTMGMYDVFEYIIPGVDGEVVGVIRHFKSKGLINTQPEGPNDLFQQMQERDFGLKRHPARLKESTGEILTSHWAANWGAPYKYGVSVLSKGFDQAPPVIIKALKRLTWAGEQTVTENLDPFHPFNELLSIGYFEDTAIGYHDDGEKELGPTVATLSLGSQAFMMLRPKAKSGLGPKTSNAKGSKPDVLKLILDHGDLVVMHGTGIQKLYEHAVTPQGKLRFALTCRYIRPELIETEEERLLALAKGRLPDGHEQYTYDGDRNSTFTSVDEDSRASAAQTVMNNVTGMVMAGEIRQRDLPHVRALLSGIVAMMAVDADEIDRQHDGAELPMPDTE